jgi:hypothetical protein
MGHTDPQEAPLILCCHQVRFIRETFLAPEERASPQTKTPFPGLNFSQVHGQPMVRTTGARHRTYNEVSSRAVVVDKAIGFRTGVDMPRNIPLRVNINKLHLKVMLVAKRVQIGSGFFDSHNPPLA